MAIKVGINGYGTIGKRVADAVASQKDMKLVGVTAHSYSFNTEVAKKKGYKLFAAGEDNDLKVNGIIPDGSLKNLLEEVDIIVDATPKKIAQDNLEKLYRPNKIKGIVQGGEKHQVTGVSFVAQCNYDEALNKDAVRVVSCNTTGLCRTLDAVNKNYGITSVYATMVRRGADPGDIHHGPINAIVPVLEMPSHHGPDARSVLHNMEIFTTALSVPSTLMHLHTVIADVRKKVNVDEVVEMFRNTTRVRIVRNAEHLRSTAEIMEFARDMGRLRGDMPEICVWKEAIGITSNSHNKLLYMQAVHQESDVIPENIDCIRAMMGFKDGLKSIKMTNETFGIK
ncbi:MAG TPA: type II glyceraldehyde-3-phosphate dehydrogenase [Candidatus Nanoarchaeia archaeon]|nr:type II glyceraldehyde-3-phosphate dehydrogenase [Candidatus Nanoarchaeia archaeon]